MKNLSFPFQDFPLSFLSKITCTQSTFPLFFELFANTENLDLDLTAVNRAAHLKARKIFFIV